MGMIAKDTRPVAYVGITGFKTTGEVAAVAEQYLDRGFLGPDEDSPLMDHKPMFGFICSNKKLADITKGGKESPPAMDLGRLTQYVPRGAIPMIHYFTPDRDRLAEEVRQVFGIDGMYEMGYCRAVQLNMAWPGMKQVETIRRDFPEMDIVLQIPKAALDEVERAIEYKDLVQYCLIDPSGGTGTEIGERLLDNLYMLHREMEDTRIGMAGGLSGRNVGHMIGKAYKAPGYPAFCIDAQGRLRTKNKISLDLGETLDYISAAAETIRDHETFGLHTRKFLY